MDLWICAWLVLTAAWLGYAIGEHRNASRTMKSLKRFFGGECDELSIHHGNDFIHVRKAARDKDPADWWKGSVGDGSTL